MFSTLVSGLEH